MLAFFLLLVIVAIVLGLVGVVVKGLLFSLFIDIVVFLGALLLSALRMRRRPGKPRRARPASPGPTQAGEGSGILSRSPGTWYRQV